MAYSFDQIFAVDPYNPDQVASNGLVTIFDPGDVNQTPIALNTTSGLPLPNPVRVNARGFGPAFTHPTLDRVAWSSGELTGFFTSYEGMKNIALSAQASAREVLRMAQSGELGAGGGGGGGGTGFLLLNSVQAIPVGTPAGTLVVRSTGAAVVNTPPPVVVPPTQPTPQPEPEPEPTPEVPADTSVAPKAVPATFVTAKGDGANIKTLTLTRPTGTVVGDTLVAVVHNSAGGGTFVPPTGWELLAGGVLSATRLTAILAHRVTASSPDDFTFDYSSAGRMVGGIFRVTGAAKTGTLSTGSSATGSAGVQIANVPAFALAKNSLVVVAAMAQATTANPWPLPTTINQVGYSRVFELGDNEPNKLTATNSILSVYVGTSVAGVLPQTQVTFGKTVSSTAAVAAGIRGI